MNQDKIGKFIAKCRKDRKLTQIELAEKLGVTEKSVGNWENGRNMPDLSLFKPLCDILNISINDLMSGEKIDDKNYINTLEENIVNMVADIEQKKTKRKKMMIITFTTIIIMMLIGRSFYMNYKLDINYDNRVMNYNISEKEFQFNIKGQSVFNADYTSKVVDNKIIYFFHSTIYLFNKRRSNWEYSHSMARLLEGKDVLFGSQMKIEIGNENIEVYYTNDSLEKVKKANSKELKNIISKSYLMCSSNN